MSQDALKIIDFHVHLCRSVEQQKKVFPRQGWPDDWYWGNPENVIAYMDTWNVTHMVSLNIMDTRRMIMQDEQKALRSGAEPDGEAIREKVRERVRSFNTWICEYAQTEPRVIPFVFADPILFGAGVVDELERCFDAGAKGVKVHPAICGHLPDDERAMPVYELCRDRGVTILTDTTAKERHGTKTGAPALWEPVLAQFRDLPIVLAHCCGERWDEFIDLARKFDSNVYFDMSGGFVDAHHPAGGHRHMPLEEGARVFGILGTDRVLFGSDGPAAGHEVPDSVSQLLQLGLDDDQVESILYGNAARLLDLAG